MNSTSEQTGTGLPPGSFSTALLEFVHRLRESGVPVSMVETIDAADCVRHIDMGDRSHLRAALGATLIKRPEHRSTFEALFDIYFALRRELRREISVTTSLDRPETRGESDEGVATGAEDEPSADLLRALLDALRQDDQSALRALAKLAIDQFGGIKPERVASERYYLYRILRQLELSELLRRALLLEREETEGRTALSDRLARDELTRRIEEFRKMLAQELRWDLSQLRGAPHVADVLHERPIEDVDFLSASPTELRRMREAIRPLAHKLAARIARRRRFRRHGRLDV